MRDILFKAKRIDNGEWVEGSLIDSGNHYQVFIYPHDDSASTMSCKTLVYHGMVAVDSNTICQYTGLTDKNGNKIWENDILDCKDRVTVVKWHTPCGTWDSVFVRYKGELCSNGIQVVEWKYRAEVIGNIFDNPELLKGGV